MASAQEKKEKRPFDRRLEKEDMFEVKGGKRLTKFAFITTALTVVVGTIVLVGGVRTKVRK